MLTPIARRPSAHWAPPPPGAASPPPWLGDYGFFFGLTESAERCAAELRSDFSRKQLAKMALNGELKLLAQSDPGWAARVIATDVRINGTSRIGEPLPDPIIIAKPTPQQRALGANGPVEMAGSTILVKKGKDPSDAIVSTEQLEAAMNELLQEAHAVESAPDEREYDAWYRKPCIACYRTR